MHFKASEIMAAQQDVVIRDQQLITFHTAPYVHTARYVYTALKIHGPHIEIYRRI